MNMRQKMAAIITGPGAMCRVPDDEAASIVDEILDLLLDPPADVRASFFDATASLSCLSSAHTTPCYPSCIVKEKAFCISIPDSVTAWKHILQTIKDAK